MSFFTESLGPPVMEGLVGWWRFNEGTGVFIGDAYKNQISGSLISGVGIGFPTWGPGKNGNYSVTNNGLTGASGNYFSTSLPNPGTILSGSFSASVWVKSLENLTNSDVVICGNNSIVTNYFFTIAGDGTAQPNNKFRLAFYDGTANPAFNSVTAQVTGQWYFLTITREKPNPAVNNGAIRLYINGNADSSATDTTTKNNKCDTINVGFQSTQPTRSTKVSVCDFRLYNRVLTAQEVRTLYRSSITDYFP